MTNCAIVGNRYVGVYYCSGPISNCTVASNGQYGIGGTSGAVTNCIIWGNTGPEGTQMTVPPQISYCDIQGGTEGVYFEDINDLDWGPGNIDLNPRFVQPGHWVDVNDANIHVEPNDPNALWVEGDYHLQRTSPCIDAGNNSYIAVDLADLDGDGDTNEPVPFDFEGKPRIIDGIRDGDLVVDMGAYETITEARTHYVDADANGANDGTSWQDAFNYIQDSFAAAIYGDEIHVAAGLHKPDCNSEAPMGTGNRSAAFELMNGMALRGGYAGFSAPDPNERNLELYKSVLSGDLDGDDGPGFVNNSENCYHIVCANSTDPTTVLDGFTITSGCADGERADGGGGGMFAEDGRPTITNCMFTANYAHFGGGIQYIEGEGVLSNCILTGNLAERYGAIYNYRSSPKIDNCTICGNSAGFVGGMYSRSGSSPAVTNSILWCNYDNSGFGEAAQVAGETGSLSYCCIQGLTGTLPGPGNICEDPCFVEPGKWVDADDPNVVVEPSDPNALWVDGDYHLKSEGWYWNTDANQWDWDEVTSRCIDAGNPGASLGDEALTLDVDPLNRFGHNLRVNMGAYGGTGEASIPPYHWALLADLNNDGTVNLVDVGHYGQYWLDAGSELPADLDRNGMVDLTDYALLGQDYFLQTTWHQ